MTGTQRACYFSVVQFPTREQSDGYQPATHTRNVQLRFVSDPGVTSFPTNDKETCKPLCCQLPVLDGKGRDIYLERGRENVNW